MKRLVCVLLILSLLIPNIAFADDNVNNINIANTVKNIVDEVINKLTDISNHWAKELIALLYDKNIIGGYPDGTFRPNHPISRAEFTKILVTSLHEDVGIKSSSGSTFDYNTETGFNGRVFTYTLTKSALDDFYIENGN